MNSYFLSLHSPLFDNIVMMFLFRFLITCILITTVCYSQEAAPEAGEPVNDNQIDAKEQKEVNAENAAEDDHDDEDHQLHRHLAGYNYVNPYDFAQRRKRELEIEKQGFADVEIDYLHRDIAAMYFIILPDLKGDHGFSVTLNDNKMVLPLSFGEIFKGLSDRYLYSAETHLEVDPETKSLKTVMVRFDRTAATGTRFIEERRDLTNPTPLYAKDLDTTEEFNTNTDLFLEYFEQKKPKGSFEKIATLTFEEVGMFDKKEKMKNQYKTYLRQTLITMQNLKQIIDRNRRVYYDHLLDMGD